MRSLFFALVLANLGFAAWSAWYAPEPTVGRRADQGLPGITLVSEVPEDLRSTGVVVETGEENEPSASSVSAEPPIAVADVPTDTEIEAPAVAVAPEPAPSPVESAVPSAALAGASGASCTSVGPFRELSQAASAAATLREAGHQPTQRVAEGEIWIGYWVYIPALPTQEEAEDVLAKVQAAGIGDAYLIPNDGGSLISLGVFSEISGVSRRRDQVRALGLEPQVVDRTRRATVYWVDVTAAEGQALDFEALQPQGRIIRLEQRPCDAATN